MSGKKRIPVEKVVELIGQGKANKEIAAELGTTTLSIKDKIHKLLREYKCKNRAELAMKFMNVA